MSSSKNVVVIHGKSFVCSPTQVEVARAGDWALYQLAPSECGKYRSLKLYFLGEKAKKRVWYLNLGLKPFGIIPNRDFGILKDYYDGMDRWVLNALNGEIGPIPKFAKPKIKAKHEKKVITGISLDRIVEEIDKAWESGKPLSIYGQTKAAGRYAPVVIGKMIGASQRSVEEAIVSMLNDGRLETETFNSHKKLKGLKSTNQGAQHGEG